VLPLFLLAACNPVDDTPPDLDALMHAAWAAWDAPGPLDDLALDLDAVIDQDNLPKDGQRGNPSRLTPPEIASLPLEHDPDPALARGISLVHRFPCADLDTLAAVLSHPDQDAIYGDYDTYLRTFDADRDAFLDHLTDRLTWTAEATASNLALGAYEQTLIGGLRRLPLTADHPFSEDAFLLARTFLPTPAITQRDNVSFDQDYQIEVYLPLPGGDILHVYGIWRQITMGLLGDMESDTVANVILTNLAGWDRKTSEACAAGVP